MNSDEVKLLAKVQKADQTFDTILDKQAKATEWMRMYDELTGSWRKEVAAASGWPGFEGKGNADIAKSYSLRWLIASVS